jgi:hypothetical protein
MMAATVGQPMAKKKATRKDAVAKIDAEVLQLAKVVAVFRNQSLAAYLSETLRPIVDRDFEAESARRSQPTKAPKDKGNK